LSVWGCCMNEGCWMAGARRMLHACLQAALGGPQHEDPMCGQQSGGGVNWKLALKGCALCCVRCLLLFLPAGDFRCMSVSARQAPCILLCF
jgi:hypothetical protein